MSAKTKRCGSAVELRICNMSCVQIRCHGLKSSIIVHRNVLDVFLFDQCCASKLSNMSFFRMCVLLLLYLLLFFKEVRLNLRKNDNHSLKIRVRLNFCKNDESEKAKSNTVVN